MEVDGVTGSRSVTRRIVKRGGMMMDGGVTGDDSGVCDTAWGVVTVVVGGIGNVGVSEVDRVSSWKDVERTDERALTRLEWQRVSEFESGSRVADGACSADGVEVGGGGLSEGGGVAYEEAKAMVLSSVDNCAAMKVSEASECDVSN